MNTLTINLASYKDSTVRVFSGQERGQKIRTDLDLSKFDNSESIVDLIVPEDLYSITPSFIIGLFGKSLKKLGESKFREKYRFKTEKKVLIEDIDTGIERALKTSSIFDEN